MEKSEIEISNTRLNLEPQTHSAMISSFIQTNMSVLVPAQIVFSREGKSHTQKVSNGTGIMKINPKGLEYNTVTSVVLKLN